MYFKKNGCKPQLENKEFLLRLQTPIRCRSSYFKWKVQEKSKLERVCNHNSILVSNVKQNVTSTEEITSDLVFTKAVVVVSVFDLF